MKPGGTIVSGPPPAQSRTHQAFRRLRGRSTVREGVFVLQPQVPSSRKSSSQHQAPASLACSRPKGSSYDLASRDPGLIDLLEEGSNRYLCERGNAHQIAEAVDRILNNSEQSKKWGKHLASDLIEVFLLKS